VLRYTKGGGSSIKSLINHLKSKHRIRVIYEGEDHKTIQAQEEIRSQIVKKKRSLFEATKKRSNNLEKLFHALITIKPKSVEPERDFSATGLFAAKLRNTLNDESVLIVMRQDCKHYWKVVDNLINNSLIKNCAGTNSSNFTMILTFYRSKSHSFQNPKNPGFPGYPKPGFKNFAPSWKHYHKVRTLLALHETYALVVSFFGRVFARCTTCA